MVLISYRSPQLTPSSSSIPLQSLPAVPFDPLLVACRFPQVSLAPIPSPINPPTYLYFPFQLL